jgi:Na+/phosphate symporter
MKDKHVFFNPFRLISPKLNAEASRLEEPPPPEMTCLEEGLLIMCTKLIEMAELCRKNLILFDEKKSERCDTLGKEVHQEEKGLTGDLVCYPSTTGDILKTLVLFPGRLERAGDLLESIAKVSGIKNRDGIPFSDKAQAELAKLFGVFNLELKNFKELLRTLSKPLLEEILSQSKEVARMTVDFALAHEERLVDGLCSPKASSLYLDILDSVKNANQHIREMCDSIKKISEAYEVKD